jgi:hypothetical protein
MARTAMAKAAFNKKTLNQQIRLRAKVETSKCYVWNIALYGAETSTPRKLDQKYLESFECGARKGWVKLDRPHK